MKIIEIKLIAVLLLCSSLSRVYAQEGSNSAGGDVFSNTGSVNYSFGQVFYLTHTDRDGIVAQGVQQPFEISVVSSIEKINGINLTYSVYPIPTGDLLILKVENYEIDNLTYHLYDINGKLLDDQQITGNETVIAMSNFIPATYILKVIQSNKDVKTFKIIKN